jgi:hypothetical protein
MRAVSTSQPAEEAVWFHALQQAQDYTIEFGRDKTRPL